MFHAPLFYVYLCIVNERKRRLASDLKLIDTKDTAGRPGRIINNNLKVASKEGDVK